MTKSNDMRWVRTERHLMRAFGEAIAQRPLEKISVTGIAREAEINKATFYLHYRDIYDLAVAYTEDMAIKAVEAIKAPEAFFREPKAFVRSLISAFTAESSQETLHAIAENGLMPHFLNSYTNKLDEVFQHIGPIAPKGPHPQIAISFFVHGALGALAQYRDEDPETLVEVLGDLLEGIAEHGKTREGQASSPQTA